MGKKTNINSKFIFPYISIILIGIIALLTINEIVFKTYRESKLEELNQEMNLMQISLNNYIKDIQNISDILNKQNSLFEIIDLENPLIEPQNTIYFLQAQKELERVKGFNGAIKGIHIYLPKSNVVLTSDTQYFRPEIFKECFQVNGWPHEEWLEYIYNPSNHYRLVQQENMKWNKKNTEILTYIASYPAGIRNVHSGSIIFFIDPTYLKKCIQIIKFEKDGFIQIKDEYDNSIMKYPREMNDMDWLGEDSKDKEGQCRVKREGELFYVKYHEDTNKWKYSIGISEKVIKEMARPIRITCCVTIGIFITMGLLIAAACASKNKKLVSEMIDSNDWLYKKLEEYKPRLVTSFLEQIFRGKFNSLEEIQYYLSENEQLDEINQAILVIYKIPKGKKYFTKSYFQYINRLKIEIQEYINEKIGEVLVQEIDMDKLCIVIPSGSKYGYQDKLEQFIEQSIEYFEDKYLTRLQVAISSRTTSILELSTAYQQVIQILNQDEWEGEKALNGEVYHYPIEREIKIINSSKRGEFEKVREEIEQIYKESIGEKNKEPSKVNVFYFQMRGTIIRLLNQLDVTDITWLEEKYKQLIQLSVIENEVEILHNTLEIYQGICKYININKKSHNERMKAEILRYIDGQYTNPNIGLEYVADLYDINSNYLSQFFKEQMGINFSSYIEKLRIEKGCELMQISPQLKIEEIAISVGYNSGQVFRKAFKRVKNITPKEYKSAM